VSRRKRRRCLMPPYCGAAGAIEAACQAVEAVAELISAGRY
jgi:hypothetical protein